MSEKMKFKYEVLSRIELSKIFAGKGATDPPVHNNPGTGADSPGSGGNGQGQDVNCVNNYYTNCISDPASLNDGDHCRKMAIIFCSIPV